MTTTPYGTKEGHHYRKLSGGGRAAKFLESRGFGWLLEVDDDDEEQKPLLLVVSSDFLMQINEGIAIFSNLRKGVHKIMKIIILESELEMKQPRD